MRVRVHGLSQVHHPPCALGGGYIKENTMKSQKVARLSIVCSCQQEVLEIDRWDDEYGLYWINIHSKPLTYMALWWRLKAAWKVFWSGKHPEDGIFIEQEDREALIKFLEEAVINKPLTKEDL